MKYDPKENDQDYDRGEYTYNVAYIFADKCMVIVMVCHI